MKKLLLCIVIMGLLLCYGTSQVYAVTCEEVFSDDSYSISAKVMPDGESVESIIQEAYKLVELEEFMELAGDASPEDYYVDLSIYAIEHIGYVELENGAPSLFISSNHPNIYVPIFVNIGDAQRIIGHIKFEYDYTKEKYTHVAATARITDEEFLSGGLKHFLEEIDFARNFDVLTSTLGCDEESTWVLVRMPMAPSNFSDKVILANKEDGVLVYDFTNAAHFPEGEEKMVLSLDEFASQRFVYEEEREKNLASHGPGLWAGGEIGAGNANKTQNNNDYSWLWIMIGASVIMATIFVVALSKHMQAKRKNG